MPAKINVNIDHLKIGDHFKVSDLGRDIQKLVDLEAETVIASCQAPAKVTELETELPEEVVTVSEETK